MTLEVQIPHGYEMMDLELPERQVVGVCDPKTMPAVPDPDLVLEQAIASRRVIYHNHKFFVRSLMKLGIASLMGFMPPDNPLRADIEECATISGLDLMVNTVLDSDRALVKAAYKVKVEH